MEYLSLEKGQLFTIMVPIAYIFYKIFDYEICFFSSKIVKNTILISILFSIPSSLILYLFKFGPYFVLIWFLSFTILPIAAFFITKKIIRRMVKQDSENYKVIDTMDKVNFIISLVIGSIFIIIPYYDRFYNLIGGGGNIRIIIISRIIYLLLGICFMTTNKVFTNYIWKYKKS